MSGRSGGAAPGTASSSWRPCGWGPVGEASLPSWRACCSGPGDDSLRLCGYGPGASSRPYFSISGASSRPYFSILGRYGGSAPGGGRTFSSWRPCGRGPVGEASLPSWRACCSGPGDDPLRLCGYGPGAPSRPYISISGGTVAQLQAAGAHFYRGGPVAGVQASGPLLLRSGPVAQVQPSKAMMGISQI